MWLFFKNISSVVLAPRRKRYHPNGDIEIRRLSRFRDTVAIMSSDDWLFHLFYFSGPGSDAPVYVFYMLSINTFSGRIAARGFYMIHVKAMLGW